MSSIEKLSAVPVQEVNRMAYKDMSRSLYLSATICLYALIVIGAIAVDNISVVFDFAGAGAVSAIAFFFPAYFYPRAVTKFKVPLTK